MLWEAWPESIQDHGRTRPGNLGGGSRALSDLKPRGWLQVDSAPALSCCGSTRTPTGLGADTALLASPPSRPGLVHRAHTGENESAQLTPGPYCCLLCGRMRCCCRPTPWRGGCYGDGSWPSRAWTVQKRYYRDPLRAWLLPDDTAERP